MFGIGDQQAANFASGFTVNPTLVASPQYLAFAQANIDSTTVAGDSDRRPRRFQRRARTAERRHAQRRASAAAGDFSAQTGTLGDYAASFYQDVALASPAATSNQTAQDDRLQEAQARQSQVSGVSLDEELTNMTTYQQAYSASARVLTVVQQLYNTLLQIQS